MAGTSSRLRHAGNPVNLDLTKSPVRKFSISADTRVEKASARGLQSRCARHGHLSLPSPDRTIQ
jgi:hypothetical protein